MATFPVPNKIGKYDVTGVIGRGGMGVVYEAIDPPLNRRVAIKMITGAFSEDSGMLQRFFREAQSLGSLQHPNIVTVFDLGECGGNPYFVMEYLEGEGLDSVLVNRRPLNLFEKISIMVQVCNGLGYAHRRGVIHRDIKPANIMIGREGGVKILDFGIAHAGQTNVSRTGEVLGTLRYMAPEQVNSKPVDARTDIFSTGVVLYQLITDHLPFDGETAASTLMKIVGDPPPPLGSFLDTCPPEIEAILLRALAKNPQERYASVDDFALDLAQLQGQLKEDLIGLEMQDVERLIGQGEVYKAQGSLLRVLNIDQQHTRANRMLREVQQRIQRDDLSNQVHGQRERVEEAVTEGRFEQGLEHVDRALGLGGDNAGLQQPREDIGAAAVRAEELHRALTTAKAAQAGDNLEAVRDAAEAVHNEAPHVHAQMESAAAGQEKESPSGEQEDLTKGVEEALNRDDDRTACEKADEGLARFPEDGTLLELKSRADGQRQVEERKHLVDVLMTESRSLLQSGRHGELKEKLEGALAQLGPDARLQSMLEVVAERLHREQMERLRVERLRDARELLHGQAFAEAILNLETAIRESGDDEEVRQLLGQARLVQADAVHSALLRAEQETVLAVRVQILEEALRWSPNDGRVKEHLHQARNLNQVISKIVVEAQKLEEDHQYDQALAKWGTVSAVYQHYPGMKDIVKRIHDFRDRAQTDARQGWINRIERTLNMGEYERAAAFVARANEEFPWDNDIMALQERTEAVVRQRAKAQKLLAEGRKLLANQQWEAGAQMMVRACQATSQDPLIQDQAVSELSQASQATIDRNWQASEMILRHLAEIQPDAGSAVLQATIQERKQEEVVTKALDAARRQEANGNLEGGLRELGPALGMYPEERRLQELQVLLEQRIQQATETARLEEARRRKEAFVLDAISRAEKTMILDRRVAILEEALRAAPEEARLQLQLSAASELRNKVASLVSEARALEKSGQYDQALARWESVSAVFPDYLDIGRILEQARQRRQKALIEAKANCVLGVQLALSTGDYKRAEEQLDQAKPVFPGDRELSEFERKVREGFANRAQAEKILEGATQAVSQEKWRYALKAFQEANAVAKSDPLIRGQVAGGLLEAADAALPSDCESSDLLAMEAAQVDPNYPLLTAVRSRIEAWKRGQLTEQCLSTAQRCMSSGDWQGALRSLDRGLAAYPDETRLLERRKTVEGEIRRLEEELRAKEVREKKALEEALQKLTSPVEIDPANFSATGIFSRPFIPPAPETAAKAALPVQPAAVPKDPPAMSFPASPTAPYSQREFDPGPSWAAASGPVPDAASSATPDSPPASTDGGFTRLPTGQGTDELNEASLQAIERQLAAFIGPLAKLLVKRAASNTTSVLELYTMLAARLEREEDRTAFLAKRTEESPDKPSSLFTKLPPVQVAPPAIAPPDASSPVEITQAVIEQTARRLAPHLGPIAPILVKREAKRAASLQEFYELLAAHIAPLEGECFLKEVGFHKGPSDSGFQPGDQTSGFNAYVGEPESASTSSRAKTFTEPDGEP